MKSYKQFINEGKNTHLEHLEDELWNEGSAGVENALRFVGEVASMLSGNTDSSINITTKWDGAPAIFCGINPENGKFFVGTKSVFNTGQPKINYTNADINKNHSGGLAEKLKTALKHLPSLGIKGVLQGDLMFTSSDLGSMKVDGQPHVTFTPNTITYAIPEGSKAAKEVRSAKMGIVFHTKYSGRRMSDMKASFNPKVKSLKKSKAVWFRDADFKDESGSSTLTSSEMDAIMSKVKEARSLLSSTSKTIEAFRSNRQVIPFVKVYMNSMVKEGSTVGNTDGLINHISSKFDNDINKLKTDAAKERKNAIKEEIVKYLKSQEARLDKIFKLHSVLTDIKIMLVRKLERIKGIGTFIRDDKGFRATSPEGFVAVDRISNKALKLVDRLEFSRSNFTVAKNWVKG
tara:strand:+ start:5267 stop:6475 length:1209 start_codon:yes stop_codon:yes gene_type:complete